jgi:hypothetical protein
MALNLVILEGTVENVKAFEKFYAFELLFEDNNCSYKYKCTKWFPNIKGEINNRVDVNAGDKVVIQAKLTLSKNGDKIYPNFKVFEIKVDSAF